MVGLFSIILQIVETKVVIIYGIGITAFEGLIKVVFKLRLVTENEGNTDLPVSITIHQDIHEMFDGSYVIR